MRKMLLFLGLSLLLISGCAARENAMETVDDSTNGILIYTDSITKTPPSGVPESTGRGEVAPGSREVPECPLRLQYFELQRSSRDEFDESGTWLLTENQCIPTFRSEDPILSDWVNGILQISRERFEENSRNLLQYAREIIREYGSEDFYAYSNYSDHALMRHDQHVASLVTISHVHAGGAHPNSVQTALNLDLKQRKVLRLEDVIMQERAGELSKLACSAIQEKFEPLGIEALYEDAMQTIQRSLVFGEMTPYWYFESGGLVIFYNQYELGPYAAGIIKAELPYERLNGILKGEFLPQLPAAEASELKNAESLNGREVIFLKMGEESEQILLETGGRIAEIQISEVFWVDETPVTQQMMLSVSEMDEHQVLVVRGGFSDESRSFAVEYRDGAGNKHLKYLHRDGLSDEP